MSPSDAQPARSPLREFARVFLTPVLWLFVVPTVGLVFARYGQSELDGEIFASIERQIAATDKIPAADKPEALSFYRSHTASQSCRSSEPRLAGYRANVCPTLEATWQFVQAERVSWAALGLGLLAVVGALALGLVAFTNRTAQYWSFMVGWRGLTLVSAAEILVQGGLAVWLSYWVTALVFHIYVLKLILMVGILAAAAAWAALRALFRSTPERSTLDAELISEADAPRLWSRLRELAARLGTEPPAYVVAGIDDNFFVTESGLTLTQSELKGRGLYVSLPLLRILEPSEADAVFAHELAHFQGGDTMASARLGPKLASYDHSMQQFASGGATRPAFFLLRMFRAIFEFALRKEQRERELAADRAARRLTSPDDVAKSLLKVAAYSSFRSETERSLFQHQGRHEAALGFAERIAGGLAAHVSTPRFTEMLKNARIPHPFDTHPLLEERLQNVGATVQVEDAPRLMQSRPERSWADEVLTGAQVEQRLWSAYEARFRENHDRSLAYRYLPSTDEERALVERFFPAKTFPMKKGEALRVDFQGLDIPGAKVSPLPFACIAKAAIQSGTFSNELRLTYHAAGSTSHAKVNLGHLGKEANAFKAVFSTYWQRDQMARQFAREKQP